MSKIFFISVLLSIVTSQKECNKSINNKITMSGIALNDKDGAILKTDSSYYLIGGLEEWDEKYYMKKVKVTGVLKREIHNRVSTDSIWVQERVGTWLIIKKAKWSLVQ